MLKLPQIARIKELQSQGVKTAEIAKELSIDWKTAEKYMQMDDFSPTMPLSKELASKLDPWKIIIDSWLEEDRKNRYKQRHTAKRIQDRLSLEFKDYDCSYPLVQRYVKSMRDAKRIPMLQELIWYPAEAQVDFGEADFIENGIKQTYKYLCLSFPYSNFGYTQIFGGETAECVCQGLKDIFEHIGGVPVRIVFDNATGVGRRVNDKIKLTELFQRFRAHYGFQISFCNPDSGHEKGNVERKVDYLRLNLFVPIPCINSIEVFNPKLFEVCERLHTKPHYKKNSMIPELFKEDLAKLQSLPPKSFNVCRYEIRRADGYGKVCLDGKHFYSTTPEWAGRDVTLAIKAHCIEILKKDGSILVSHRRSYATDRTDSLDYSTSLAVLTKNIGAWQNSGIRAKVSDELRTSLDAQNRQELRKTLNLMHELSERYGFDTAVSAMEEAVSRNNLNFCDTAVLASRLAGYGIETPPELGPDLSQYDQLLLGKVVSIQ